MTSTKLKNNQFSENPFPASAISRVSKSEKDFDTLTVQTKSVSEVNDTVKAYLNGIKKNRNSSSPNESLIGQSIAVVGEYGTGKTHLALEVNRLISQSSIKNIHVFYMDAPSDSFVSLYKQRFIPQLKKSELLDRVNEYFADILAEELASSKLTSHIAISLKNRDISPQEVVDQIGLMGSLFRQKLTEQLKNITEKEDFSIALSLIVMPEFQDAVWEWFKGNTPDQALVDRGIARTLDTEANVLEAIGVVAFLFGRQNHQFTLIIDEVEKVLVDRKVSTETMLAFKKLMEAVRGAVAILILIGLPDFLEVLPEDAKQRLTKIIRPSGLSAQDVENYVRNSRTRIGMRSSLSPFDKDTVRYLSDIAGGNARKIVRLCYHIYEQATARETKVTKALIREVARDQFEISTSKDIEAEVTRIVDLNGWHFERNKEFKNHEEKIIDFWIPVSDDSGCCILYEKSILDKTNAKKIIKESKFVKDDDKKNVSLIVNGHLAENLEKEIKEAFDRVFVFESRSFHDDFGAYLKGTFLKLEQGAEKDKLNLLLDKVDQMSRQQFRLGRQVEELLSRSPNTNEIRSLTSQSLKDFFTSLGKNDTLDNHRAHSLIETVRIPLKAWLDMCSFNSRSRREEDAKKILSQSISVMNAMQAELSAYESRFMRLENNTIFRDIERNIEHDAEDDLGRICRRFDNYVSHNLKEIDKALQIIKMSQRHPDHAEYTKMKPFSMNGESIRETLHSLERLGEEVYRSYRDLH